MKIQLKLLNDKFKVFSATFQTLTREADFCRTCIETRGGIVYMTKIIKFLIISENP